MRLLMINILPLLSLFTPSAGHARLKYPPPLGAPPVTTTGDAYNAPLAPDGSDFPCKGLLKDSSVNQTPVATWKAGQQTYFEILREGQDQAANQEGPLAAHSGGSCQAALSFDKGTTWKVLHSWIGGCPRDVAANTNFAGPNQTFPFMVPEMTKSGNVIFSWSWIPGTGNRNEFYQNCAVVNVQGLGTSTLDNLPDMYVGQMVIAGQINQGQCLTAAEDTAIVYPNPGDYITQTSVTGITFTPPTAGKCYAPGTKKAASSGTPDAPALSSNSSISPGILPPPSVHGTGTAASASSATAAVGGGPSPSLNVQLDGKSYPCSCVCSAPK